MYTEETLKEDLVWDYVKDDVESFDLSREDAQFRNKQRRKIEGSAGWPRLTWKMAVKTESVMLVVLVWEELRAKDSRVPFVTAAISMISCYSIIHNGLTFWYRLTGAVQPLNESSASLGYAIDHVDIYSKLITQMLD